MRIACVEVQNYRKLASTHIEFALDSTLLVGANNSGKTSALNAMRAFLVEGARLNMNDITLSKWKAVNSIGLAWLAGDDDEGVVEEEPWRSLLPSLDLWLHVDTDEVHKVSDLLPTLDWSGGLLGVRVALEPKNLEQMFREFRQASTTRSDLLAIQLRSRADPPAESSISPVEEVLADDDSNGSAASHLADFPLWPATLVDFVSRRFNSHFALKYYVLDPAKLVPPVHNLAIPQAISGTSSPLPDNPLRRLIRIDEISAQRGLGEQRTGSESTSGAESVKLSRQLGDYYAKHLDPTDAPAVTDLDALTTIAGAQREFDKRLADAFKSALAEMESLGYPGVTDPRIRVASRLSATDSLNHESAVSFLVDDAEGQGVELSLPEGHSGLGYQNLISMVFRLMSFRDQWMRVGKVTNASQEDAIEPIHLVLIEEPEAHLHVQVQQVFAKKAYSVLRNHRDLGESSALTTQLVVSTHSSYVSHELPFANLRYFRRLPAGVQESVPTSSVIGLGEVFGSAIETKAFVTRYLRAHHADLFFADAIILVEGPAERMLLPNFIEKSHSLLNSAYITILEIGGSHAHRLAPLITALQIPTLVVTDIDASANGNSSPVKRDNDQVTSNPTLKDWAELGPQIDALLEASDESRTAVHDELFAVRFAYQGAVQIQGESPALAGEALPSTFEDALALENLEFFGSLEGNGLTRKFRDLISAATDVQELSDGLFAALKDGKKAEFALDVLASAEFPTVRTPAYIDRGLVWLESVLKKQMTGNAIVVADASTLEVGS